MFGKHKKDPRKDIEQDPKALGFDKLIDIKQSIDREIASRKDTEIEALKSRATAAASALGITLAELFGLPAPAAVEPRKAKRVPRAKNRVPENSEGAATGKFRTAKQDKLDLGTDSSPLHAP